MTSISGLFPAEPRNAEKSGRGRTGFKTVCGSDGEYGAAPGGDETDFPGPMDVQMSEKVIARWQTLYDEGVKIQMQLAEQGDQAGYRKQSHDVTPQLSKEFGAASLEFTQVAETRIEQTRTLVDGLMTTTRIVIISGTLFGLLILIFADRYLVKMMQRPLNNVRQHFRRIACGGPQPAGGK